MIGKRFRSLPFIFANDNYTLSPWRSFLLSSLLQPTVLHAPIRKTALRAYRGWRHCFTHSRFLLSSLLQPPVLHAPIRKTALRAYRG